MLATGGAMARQPRARPAGPLCGGSRSLSPLPKRLKLIQENCERLSVNCVEITDHLPKSPESFDHVLVDAPCSNTGVLRRRVDLRWRIRPEEIQKLASMQVNLLKQAAALLKPRGLLVYSTCSLEPEENQEVVKKFLSDNPDFSLEHERELTPFADAVDGAYVARLKRIN